MTEENEFAQAVQMEELQQRVADAEAVARVAEKEKRRAADDSARQRKENADLLKRLEELERLSDIRVAAPKWTAPKLAKKGQATAMLHLSDWHFDEKVNPEELVGPTNVPINQYNREIAEARLKKTFEGAIDMSQYMDGFNFDGIVVQIGGDMAGGEIHEELKETNDAPSVLDTVDHFIDPMAAGLEMLADYFGNVYVVGCTGNHGRTSRKPQAKRRVRSNYDWFLNRQLARHFKPDKRFTWNLPDTADVYWDVYGHKHLLSHGDQARGGVGVSKLMTPISLLDARKRTRDQAVVEWLERTGLGTGKVYSHMWIGHWHTYLQVLNVSINGSGKGIDEYSFQGNFGFEEPAQAFAVITPKYNVTSTMAIYPQDPIAEGWGQAA